MNISHLAKDLESEEDSAFDSYPITSLYSKSKRSFRRSYPCRYFALTSCNFEVSRETWLSSSETRRSKAAPCVCVWTTAGYAAANRLASSLLPSGSTGAGGFGWKHTLPCWEDVYPPLCEAKASDPCPVERIPEEFRLLGTY